MNTTRVRYREASGMPRAGVPWEDREDYRLREMVATGATIQEMSADLGRSQGSVYQRARTLRVRLNEAARRKRRSPNYWTEEEDRVILEGGSVNEMAAKLPHRTVGSIWQRRDKLRNNMVERRVRECRAPGGAGAPSRVITFERIDGRPTFEMLMDARRRMMAPRSVVAWIQGDPPPGYSALDRRNSSSAAEPELGRDADQMAEAVT